MTLPQAAPCLFPLYIHPHYAYIRSIRLYPSAIVSPVTVIVRAYHKSFPCALCVLYPDPIYRICCARSNNTWNS